MTTMARPTSGRCSGRRRWGDAAMTPIPRTMHQSAIAAGSVEPKGKGTAATVAHKIKDEIRFDRIKSYGLPHTFQNIYLVGWHIQTDYGPVLERIAALSVRAFVAVTIGSLTVAVTNLI